MHRLVFAAFAGIVALGGCTQSRAPAAEEPASEASSATAAQQMPAAMTASPVAEATSEAPSDAIGPSTPAATTTSNVAAAPVAVSPALTKESATAAGSRQSTAAPKQSQVAQSTPAQPMPPAKPAVADVAKVAVGDVEKAAVTNVAKVAPPTSPKMDLAELEQRLRDTNAIGVFTKLSLKNQVDDLLSQFRDFYKGRVTVPMAELRKQYEILMLKVLTLLQDSDQQLAAAISSSREDIWSVLADPQKFAQI